jgi:DNA polymerase I-like protein with 3'-5' exonuclease and polymerase domains
MAWRYGIQFGRHNYDTMIAHHRCFSEVEKSLGHCSSLWTWEQYHKDSGCFEPKNSEQEQKLWHYNAKDVYVMYLIRRSIDQYAAGQIGLKASIAQGNNMIYSYVMNTLMGIRVDGDMITKISTENDAMMTQMLRVCKLLLKRDFLPTSTKQCHQYFSEQLWYKVMGRSKTNNPSYNDLAMQKLKLAYPDNPMLDLCLMYRSIKKETGSLKFSLWNPSQFRE